MSSDREPLLLEVTDIKQYQMCKRVVFYRYCLPRIRPVTGKMEEGIRRHREEVDREERRSLRAYGLAAGERHFDITLRSAELGLVGQLDLIITTQDEAIPVEYKLSERQPGPHVRGQHASYALLIEACWNMPVHRAFSYLLPLRKAVEVPITVRQRREVQDTIKEIHTMITQERLPDPPATQRLCVSCEFRRFCNDVL